VDDFIADFQHTVEDAAVRLLALPDAATVRRPASARWSPREVLGHLVDSATNNHGRFVRAQLGDDLVFQGYAQDDWVRVQRYAEAPWLDLVALWRLLNLHLSRVMAVASPSERSRPRSRHNLHEVAWSTVPVDRDTTLEYFMRDYVAHLRHHLSQIPLT